MNTSHIAQLKLLREEYICKYNAKIPTTPLITPKYNPTFWDKMILPLWTPRLYNKYNLDVNKMYDTNTLINMAEISNPKHKTLLVYDNENKQFLYTYKSRIYSKMLNAQLLVDLMAYRCNIAISHITPRLTFEEFKNYLDYAPHILRDDIGGINRRKYVLHRLIISSIDVMIYLISDINASK